MSETTTETHNCPHCSQELQRWQTPIDSSWGGAIRLVCFNDDCPYFVKGWEVMMERQSISASYRHMMDPESGWTGPIPVWSKTALREGILE